MNILFICKHNRFRSKVAEAIFNKYNKNKSINVKSAGVYLDMSRPYVSKNVLEALKEKGIILKDDLSHSVDELSIEWADKIIIVADNVDPKIFPKEKVSLWKIEDADQFEINGVKEANDIQMRSIIIVIDKIEGKVKKLIKELSSNTR